LRGNFEERKKKNKGRKGREERKERDRRDGRKHLLKFISRYGFGCALLADSGQ